MFPMKRSLIALAALAAAGAASAQSSVTLYGRVDVNVTYQDPGSQATVAGGALGDGVWKLNDGGDNGIGGSRWGLRGTEDLGGGLKAYFVLEQGFRTDNGNASNSSQSFSRQAYVALGSASFGDLRLGRVDTLTRTINLGFVDVTAEGELTVTESVVGSNRPLFQNLGSRVNNAAYYISPNLGGFQIHALVGAGEGATARHDGLAGTFRSGPFGIGGAYERYDNGDSYNEVYTIGGNWNFGFGTVFAGYQNTSDFGNNTAAANSGIDHDAWNIGLLVPFGNWQFRGQYTSSSVDQPGSAPDFDQEKYGVSARYSLSKRTTLYGVATQRSGDRSELYPRETEVAFGVAHTF
jgi:predicted porin